MNYEIHIEAFEGPFDLLLHLIRVNEVDIYDIPIAEITAQYLNYLRAMEAMDLDIASSFVAMAATLLAIKARMLLPKPVQEEDSEEPGDARDELVKDLLEYMRFKEAAQTLDAIHKQQTRFYSRPNEEELYLNLFADDNPLDGKTLDDLMQAFTVVLQKVKGREEVLDIPYEQITIKDKIDQIYQLLCQEKNGFAFSSIFDDCNSKMEIIITFLALLELARLCVLKIKQNKSYAQIYIYAAALDKYQQ